MFAACITGIVVELIGIVVGGVCAMFAAGIVFGEPLATAVRAGSFIFGGVLGAIAAGFFLVKNGGLE